MDMTDSIAVSVSALDAQRRRLNVIASNLANAQSTKTAEGGPYRRRDVVFQSAPVGNHFHQVFRKVASGPTAHALDGVRVSKVIEDHKPGHQIYDPRHPDADPKGFVRLPNINVMEEMVNMIGASRSYEANVQAISATKAMWNRALDIGR
ncbi:flagellar component of cell-proximal portion of basal-body rod [Nitrospira sp. KM1]|uniref:flagellar basal body rod protein FlgC n=1 Tax=Nitrospira sp. KM1 TaxID=1936990 RepID=UPI0013A742C4|nr:flagellar basal body rod protein FlgC [Nitrospira sp. KM1]BCA54820.1 flagellar component of cell-proximal portion of basal-body rod [Nitrospira sp. KM1]